MANSMALIIRRANNAQLYKRLPCFSLTYILDNQVRTLYNASSLGIDGYLQQKTRTKNHFANISEKFITKMKEFTADDSKGMVFTEDLKNMIHLASTDEDIELVVKMIKRFATQNSSLRFGSYIYGPVAMRMFHHYKKPEIALECFKDPEIGNTFNQLISYQILLDLLFTSGKYKEVLEAFEVIKERQIQGAKYPKNVVVLVYAALYKMNTAESFEYATKLYRELKECGHNLMRRAVTFCAALALNQGHGADALEVLVGVNNQNYVTIRNLKVLALCDIGRLEDTIPIFQSIINQDIPDNRTKQTFSVDVIVRAKEAFDKCDNSDLKLEFNRLYDIFQSQGHVVEETLDEILTKEIAETKGFNQRDQRGRFERNARPFGDRVRETGRSFQHSSRPGLAELQ